MAGYEFLGECPFADVYIHANILDAQGRKMSKSLGNGIDPREMIDRYGADAVRFTLMILTTEGQDVKLAPTKFELGRNFMNKVWNAARYVLSSVPPQAHTADPGDTLTDRWILSRTSAAIEVVSAGLQSYRFHDAANALYKFVWDDFCDWYLEASKDRISAQDASCGATLVTVLKTIVRLVQPFAPYLAAELAEVLGEEEPAALLPWPVGDPRDAEAEADMERIQEVIRAIRRIRNENRVQEKARLKAYIKTEIPKLLVENETLLVQLARLESLEVGSGVERPEASGTEVLKVDEVYVSLEGVVDFAAEKARKERELDKLRGHLKGIEAKLGNESFTTRAKPEVVERERERAQEIREKIARLEEASRELDG